MDLGAYVQIKDIEPLVQKNGIDVSRVRGYRLMKDEKPVSELELKDIINDNACYKIEEMLSLDMEFFRLTGLKAYSGETPAIKKKKYLYEYKIGEDYKVGVKWNNVHGKLRKRMKFIYKQVKKGVYDQYGIWNKYAGQDNVLYIHAKLGSWNWSDKWHKDCASEDWYLDSCDDSFDRAYCDIYARLKDV